MKKGLTEVVIVLDESGSMNVAANDTIGGINNFIKTQKEIPGEVTFTLALFSDNLKYKYYRVNLNSVGELTGYSPNGSTALLDSACDVIDNIGQALAMTPEENRPEKVIFAIMTDGEENVSRRFTRNDLANKIKVQSELYKWEFLFLGANFDTFGVGASYNIKLVNTFSYTSTSDMATRGMDMLSMSVSNYRTTN